MQTIVLIVTALCLSLGACAESRFGVTVAGQLPPGVTLAGQLTLAVQPNPAVVNPAFVNPQNPSFAYVTATNYPVLRLAQITEPPPPSGPLAADFKTLIDTSNTIDGPDGGGQYAINHLWASPGNLRVLAFVTLNGTDSIDQDLNAWNLADGTVQGFFNELTFINYINNNKTACPSDAFNKYLASQQGPLDWNIPEDPVDVGNLPQPKIQGWLDDTSVALSWYFPVQVTDGMTLHDTFRAIVAWPQASAPPVITCVDQLPTPPSPPTALSADPTIRLHGVPVKWALTLQPVPQPLFPARQAQLFAGVIWP